MRPTRADLLAKINATPSGMTTRQIVEALGGDPNSISSVLSKLACYGFIKRVVLNKRGDSIWRPRDA